MARLRLRLSAAALAFAAVVAPVRAETVDTALLLALDASSSVDREEYFLQTEGISIAFADEEIQAAIAAGPTGRIAVAVVSWSHPDRQSLDLDWRIVTAETAPAFAETMFNLPRNIEGGGTAVGAALLRAGQVMESLPFTAMRRVIDVSGDGKTSAGPLPAVPRDALIAQGITVNGLAIVNEEADVDDYYAAEVIGGPGAFVEVARDYEDFRRAIRRKLLRELRSDPLVAEMTPLRAAPP
ncbi:DUF1194 domain-containing protein [Zavarzinia compransoris]|uniref:DUF1194 domain-containing protein n=1 Tax=Zavarzinia marina TaxID=2911065 RepID=UPI001F38F79E|nr:DUF1194 domain-containing protein [Zavarzinia marina]MCF4164964.1 DUF1194 domain-containing protein [Zavarzinia marina]